MAFPNSTWGDIASTTIANYSAEMADNVTAHNALLKQLKQSQGDTLTGGNPIIETFTFAENGNGGSYSGADTLPTAQADVVSAAQFNLAQYACPVVFTGTEMLQNTGKQQMFDLIKARVKVAQSTMQNLINRHLYLDGTGNNGKNITGLAAGVVLSPTSGTYGGIDRSVAANAFWRNQKFQATVDSTGVATAATIQAQWNAFIINLTRAADRPTMIIASPSVYALFEASLQPLQRFMSADKGSAGFKSLDFQGIPVVFDTAASGIGSNVAYFLNTDYLHYRPHKDRNFIALDDKSAVNQDATVRTLAWAGNLTCSYAGIQGLYSNT